MSILLSINLGLPKIRWCRHGYLILWNYMLLKFSVIMNLLQIYGMLLKRCMEIKITRHEFFNSKETLHVFNRKLLANLAPDYEDLRSHILMNSELPSLGSVCATIQREEVRRKVMNCNLKTEVSEARAYMFNHKRSEERSYKGKRPELKCNHCHNLGHTVDRCWVLHPELKPKFPRENMPQKRTQPSGYKANHVTTMAGDGLSRFSSSPITLINEFASYLQAKQGESDNNGKSAALLGQFAGFLSEDKNGATDDT
ncbi:uncharacterized protein LOC119990224 isoform X2 [Tripterygium wilfordii]|uniref:uncharacterized protein LOC119990224 isoform X2 n=1 Tax=Tripterygium wilfordii TaxID=458696 RepID=UPI0018F83A40|nr:uncharacterized protein LOC119990224 isoform X2 [Tripterygium wilfordii]